MKTDDKELQEAMRASIANSITETREALYDVQYRMEQFLTYGRDAETNMLTRNAERDYNRLHEKSQKLTRRLEELQFQHELLSNPGIVPGQMSQQEMEIIYRVHEQQEKEEEEKALQEIRQAREQGQNRTHGRER